MKKENKGIISADNFSNRIRAIMKNRGISIEELCERVNANGYSITKSNLSIYLNRIPNIQFLIALCRSLNISSDCLLGLTDVGLNETNGLNYDFSSKRYGKYRGNYYFYFCPTVSSRADRYHTAKLTFKDTADNSVCMVVTTDEGRNKEYYGNLILSNNYQIGYITLREENIGEIVHLSFCDPVLNSSEACVELSVGLMLSVSGGDLKRVPVASRFIMSRRNIPEEKQKDTILANLLLNTKYIIIEKSKFEDTIGKLKLDEEKKKDIKDRLPKAFKEQNIYKIEEAFILNTIKNDCSLSNDEIAKLISSLRLKSIAVSNNKVDRELDSRMYLTVKNDMEDDEEVISKADKI